MELRQRMDKLKQRQRGFTLVELIVVIAIIGILAGVMLPKYFGFTDDARRASAIADAKSIRSIQETFYATHGSWPTVAANGTTKTDLVADETYTFDGKITLTTSGTPAVADGGFTYKSNKTNAPLVTCDVNGNISAP